MLFLEMWNCCFSSQTSLVDLVGKKLVRLILFSNFYPAGGGSGAGREGVGGGGGVGWGGPAGEGGESGQGGGGGGGCVVGTGGGGVLVAPARGAWV